MVTGAEMTKLDMEQSERVVAKKKLMPTAQLLAEYHKMMRDLNAMTNGLGDIAYIKANTARTAWRELRNRGIDPEGHS